MWKVRKKIDAFLLLITLSDISPLFILWAIRGNSLIPDRYFICLCAVFGTLPHVLLWLYICMVRKHKVTYIITAGSVYDYYDNAMVYIFVMLLPLYSGYVVTLRDMVAMLTAVSMVVFIFWYIKIQPMNILFSMLGYRMLTVAPPDGENGPKGSTQYILTAKRNGLASGERITAYSLSNTVYIET